MLVFWWGVGDDYALGLERDGLKTRYGIALGFTDGLGLLWIWRHFVKD